MEAHFTDFQSLHISIAGLGLMGGSLALSLQGKCRRLSGVDTDQNATDFAMKYGLVDEILSFEEALASDLLILAAPVKAILKMLETIHKENPPGSLVILDLGSTKIQVAEAMRNLPAGCEPIGGHPMCGKESSGAWNAEAGLFQNRIFILTPVENTSPRARKITLNLVDAVGGKPLFLRPEENDRLAAFTSHAPYLAAAALVWAAEAAEDERVWQVAASGFRDTTRLAASDLTMMCDILITNKEPVLEALSCLRFALDKLTTLVQSGDSRALQSALEPVRKRRKGLGASQQLS